MFQLMQCHWKTLSTDTESACDVMGLLRITRVEVLTTPKGDLVAD